MNENLEPRMTRLENKYDDLSKMTHEEITGIRVHLAENSKDLSHQNSILKAQQETLKILTKEVSIHIRRTELLEQSQANAEKRQEEVQKALIQEIRKIGNSQEKNEERKWARFQYWLHKITYWSIAIGLILQIAKTFGFI